MKLARIEFGPTHSDLRTFECPRCNHGAVAELVGNEVGVVSGVINLESSGVEASDWRPRHDEHYHEA
jgi:transcription elongation factor Elf1